MLMRFSISVGRNLECWIAEEEGRRDVLGIWGVVLGAEISETGSSEHFLVRLAAFEQIRANSSKFDQILAATSCVQCFSGAFLGGI